MKKAIRIICFFVLTTAAVSFASTAAAQEATISSQDSLHNKIKAELLSRFGISNSVAQQLLYIEMWVQKDREKLRATSRRGVGPGHPELQRINNNEIEGLRKWIKDEALIKELVTYFSKVKTYIPA